MTFVSPCDTAGVLDNNDGNVFVSSAIACLINGNIGQPVETLFRVGLDTFTAPRNAVANCSPIYLHEGGHRFFRHVETQPGDLLLKVLGESGAVYRPRDRLPVYSVFTADDARPFIAKPNLKHACIKVSPQAYAYSRALIINSASL